MINHEGKTVDEALPSMPVEILGMNSSAYAGAEFFVTKDEEEAKIYLILKTNSAIIKFLQKIKQLCLMTPKVKMN